MLAKDKRKPYHIEGLENSEWVLLDYINVVVHVFQKTCKRILRS